MESIQNILEIVEKRIALRSDEVEVKKLLNEISYLLNNEEDSINLFFFFFCSVYLKSSPDRMKIDQMVMKRAKYLRKKIVKRSYELHQLLYELDNLREQEGVDVEINLPFCDSLKIIHSASEIGLKNIKNTSLEIGDKYQDLYEKGLGSTIKEMSSNDDYFPEMENIFYAVGQFYESHIFIDIDRESSARGFLRAFLKSLIVIAEGGVIPKSILNISSTSISTLINVALDLPVERLMDDRSTRSVFAEFFISG